MKTLVLSEFLRDWTGSEVVASEVAEYFHADMSAFDVDLRRFPQARPLSSIRLSDYELVWAQHSVVSVLLGRMEEGELLPTIVTAHLSPYLGKERPARDLVNDYAALAAFNSEETQSACADGLTVPMRVFHNAAPRAFHRATGPREMRRILVVSNHPPRELREAMRSLRRKGFVVNRIGWFAGHRRIRPAEIFDADAVVTIGKTVQYALAARVPVYMYDHFGGDGWLDERNFDLNAYHNFSGRPGKRRLSAEQIVQEIMSGPVMPPPGFAPLEDFLASLPQNRVAFRRRPSLHATARRAAVQGARTTRIAAFRRAIAPAIRAGRLFLK